MATTSLALVSVLIALFSFTLGDPEAVQDICIADSTAGVKVNGFPCKVEKVPNPDDFFTAVLAGAAATDSYRVRAANVNGVPGLNTLGVSLSRVEIAVGGVNLPHTHPRATEMVFVLEGNLTVGFITTSNEHIKKELREGHVFVFPKGLVHYQMNTGTRPASMISAFNSQLPGTQSFGLTLFGANPEVADLVLAKALRIGLEDVKAIKAGFD